MPHVLLGSPTTAKARLHRRYRDARLVLSAALTDHAARLSGRTDLVVSVVTETDVAAPGVFFPTVAAIQVRAALFERPSKGRRAPAPADPKSRPVGYGVFVHETAHARHSAWRPGPEAGAAEVAAAMLLEEIRIEAAQANRRRCDRHWLRHSAKALILADAVDSPRASAWATAQKLALIAGRGDAGILTYREAASVTAAAEEHLGASLVAALRDVWRRVLTIDDDDADAMLQAGRDWCALLDTDPDEPEPSEPQGPATEAEAQAAEALSRAVRVALRRLAAAVAAEDPEPESVDVPDPEASGDAPTPTTWDDKSNPITGHRAPTAGERHQADVLAGRLNRAGMRERTTVNVASALPPGRLDMRAALARDAQRAAGAIPTATPWRRTVRRSNPAPPLRVGIAVDVSASMKAFTGPTASTAWILARAVQRSGLDAASATVAFGGQTVTPITRPGTAPARVTEFDAHVFGHPLASAIADLDRSLGLARTGTARLLVVVSDGGYRADEREAAQKCTDVLRASGCAVLWIGAAGQHCLPLTGSELVAVTDPADAGDVIGTTAVKALTRT